MSNLDLFSGKDKREDFSTGDKLFHWFIYQASKKSVDQTVMFE